MTPSSASESKCEVGELGLFHPTSLTPGDKLHLTLSPENLTFSPKSSAKMKIMSGLSAEPLPSSIQRIVGVKSLIVVPDKVSSSRCCCIHTFFLAVGRPPRQSQPRHCCWPVLYKWVLSDWLLTFSSWSPQGNGPVIASHALNSCLETSRIIH